MRFASLLFLLSLALPAHAGFRGSLEFSPEEKAAHLEKLESMLESSAGCLEADLERHKTFIKKYGVSAFYGDNSSFAKSTGPDGKAVPTTIEEKRAKLREQNISEELITQMVPSQPCKGGVEECPLLMQPTSCIGLAIRCLSKGMKDTGQEAAWQKLRRFILDNNSTGDAVLDGLQKLGWKIAYWNPDTSKNEQWDEEDQTNNPGNPKNIWGQHALTWKTVQERQRYYFNTVDDWSALVDFKHHTPRAAKDAQFFIGIANLGYHVFPGTYGQIIEGHSSREIDDKHTVEKSWFNPQKFLGGGGPRGGPYKSGIMALPPGVIGN